MRLTNQQIAKYRNILNDRLGNQVILNANGIFEVYNISEIDADRVVRLLKQKDIVDFVNKVKTNNYNFNHISFNRGFAEPTPYYNVRGMLKDITELEKLTEEIKKQDSVEYKGFVIEHFPFTWNFEDGKTFEKDGWIIQAPGYYVDGDERFTLPLRCHDKASGPDIDFKTLEEAKKWIDDFGNNYKITIEYGDEIHAWPARISKNEAYNQSFFEYLSTSLQEAIEIHDHLNPKLWDKDNNLLPEVKTKILEIVTKFKEQLAVDNVKLEIADIYLLGSNANYNYNEDSDLDLHIIADETFDCSEEHLKIIYNAYKSLFNSKYDIKVRGIDTEVYVENKDNLTNVSSGIYSLNNGWIKKPTRSQIPEIDQIAVDIGVNRWQEKYFNLILEPTVNKIDKYIDDLYDVRTNSIAKDGEFGEGNLIFKELRRRGYIDDLKELKTQLISQELSLE